MYKLLKFTSADIKRILPPFVSNPAQYIKTGGYVAEKTYILKQCGLIDCLNIACPTCSTARASWAKKVKERDHVCQNCNTSNLLVAHHLLQRINFPEKAFDLNNGITLCEECHHKAHAARKAK